MDIFERFWKKSEDFCFSNQTQRIAKGNSQKTCFTSQKGTCSAQLWDKCTTVLDAPGQEQIKETLTKVQMFNLANGTTMQIFNLNQDLVVAANAFLQCKSIFENGLKLNTGAIFVDVLAKVILSKSLSQK